ncbi:MAG: hypothetical protein WC809_10310 [Sinimarinibacterium sp.]|jgi:hypothetical protein
MLILGRERRAHRPGRLRILLGFVAALSGPARAGASDFHEAIAGIWRTDISKLTADATIYFVIVPDSSCQQVVRIKLLGFTKWTARTCTWTLDRDVLTLSLKKSATPDAETQATSKVAIAEITPDAMVISSDGERQRWARAPELPAEFRERLLSVTSP